MSAAPVDTICAVATAAGRAGVGVVRLSGPEARAIITRLTGTAPRPRHAHYVTLKRRADESVLDDGIVLYFPGPHSYTGEDVVEWQGHGNPVLLDAAVEEMVGCGARTARPGEFTERAFLNGRMDLAQAEAVADLIEAGSTQAATAARRSLTGAFSRRVDAFVEHLIHLRMYIEAALDFPEEEIDFLSDTRLRDQLADLRRELADLLGRTGEGVRLREGLQLVIVGQPNAGKSSLLNQLAGESRAIVTEIAGTTRDVLRAEIMLDGLPIHVIDTAGLRESDDPIEQEGIRRAWEEVERADLILHLIDGARGRSAEDEETLARLPDKPLLTVINKVDLTDQSPSQAVEDGTLRLSARTGAGVDALRRELRHLAGVSDRTEDPFIARRRHLEALERARDNLAEAGDSLALGAGELAAESLRRAQTAMEAITGRFTADDLLGEIFGSFCIGK
ncbi:tRNA uridine-5-carboxymethylaminomethyl(34) synthesis GTPase MnmE [Guyparkeria halophila]|uniref:tRNA modification GTPase MnmE n=1 Tax=Guyparkeria halophila TaxID=47960 RepID=A0A6I6D5I3_9GAMM|nr:tRNA uridine-5-carboxymethylaminomethyl(34) synthesis GTPase MnmE [Guyparkeria halophila]QGT79497.1 tRNA uridine-5-carboxymethylaminomethyl(34) synthesis GTPase MnmE [Guyparkeria halophila]